LCVRGPIIFQPLHAIWVGSAECVCVCVCIWEHLSAVAAPECFFRASAYPARMAFANGFLLLLTSVVKSLLAVVLAHSGVPMRPFDLKSENDLGTFYGISVDREVLFYVFLNARFGRRFSTYAASRTRKKCSRRVGAGAEKRKMFFWCGPLCCRVARRL
jgi:hypothetical protein